MCQNFGRLVGWSAGRLVGWSALLTVGLQFAAEVHAEPPARPFQVATQASVLSLDPHAINERFSNAMLQHVYEPLLTRSPDLRIQPGLAESWQQTGPLRWQIKLRNGVHFHHGALLSAEDAAFSLQRAQSAESPLQVFASQLGQVTVLDARTVQLQTPQPQPLVPELLTLIPIMNRAWVQAHGIEQPLSPARRANLGHASGTGPFTLLHWQAGDHMALQRNPAWWGEAAGLRTGNLERATVRTVVSTVTRMAALATGEVDLVPDVPPNHQALFAQQPQLKSAHGLENRIVYLGMDVASPTLRLAPNLGTNPLKNPQVRQALAQAINWAALQQKVWMGEHALATAVVPPNVWGHPGGQVRPPVHNLPAARQALAQAGYPQGFDIQLACPADRHPTDEVVCKSIAAMWAHLGLRPHLTLLPRAQYFNQIDAPGQGFDVFLMSWGGATSDAMFTLRPLFHSPGTADGAGHDNYGGVADPLIDGWLHAADLELDPTRRLHHLQNAVLRISGQTYAIPLYQQSIHWAMHQTVTAQPRPDARLELHRTAWQGTTR